MNTKISFSLLAITQKTFLLRDIRFSLFSDDVDDGHLQEGNYHIFFHHILVPLCTKLIFFLALQISFDLLTTLSIIQWSFRIFHIRSVLLFSFTIKIEKNLSLISMISWLITINFIWLHFYFINSFFFVSSMIIRCCFYSIITHSQTNCN